MDIFERNSRLAAITLQREGMVARLSHSTADINTVRGIILPGHPPIQFQYLLDALEAWYIAERTALMDKFRQEDNTQRQVQDHARNAASPTSTVVVESIIKE